MENKDFFISKYTLNDFFNKIFKLIRYTWKNTLFLFSIVSIPLIILSLFLAKTSLRQFTAHMSNIQNLEHMSFPMMMNTILQFSSFLILIFLVSFLAFIIYTFVRSCITLTAFNAVQKKSISLPEIISIILKEKLVPIILNLILKGLILSGIYIGFIILVVILSLVSSLIKAKILLVLLIAAAVIAMLYIIIWLFYAWRFTAEAIIWDNQSATSSLGKSYQLVKKNWWRVFGITLLIGLVFHFALSMVTSPIVFAGILPKYVELMGKLLESPDQMENMTYLFDFYSQLMEGMFGFAVVIMIASYIQGLAEMLIFPVFNSLFYIDLKVRKNELVDEAGTALSNTANEQPAAPISQPGIEHDDAWEDTNDDDNNDDDGEE